MKKILFFFTCISISFASCSSEDDLQEAKGDYIDLNLPSGTLWARCNIGATSPEQGGFYFSWGEVSPKEDYSWESYKWALQDRQQWKGYSKYTIEDNTANCSWYSQGIFQGDNLSELMNEDDAAYICLGENWRMPTVDQIKELTQECDWKWSKLNGVPGYTITGENGNSIFLPAVGSRSSKYSDTNTEVGYILSRSLDKTTSGRAYNLYFDKEIYGFSWTTRETGLPIRPVFKKNKN